MKILLRFIVTFCLQFLNLLASNTIQGLIIRIVIAFCIPPLSIILTLISKKSNPISLNLWINFALTTTPPLGNLHAIWFALNEKFNKNSNTQKFSQINTQQSSPPNTIPTSQSNTKIINKTYQIVSIIVIILTLIFSTIIGAFNAFIGAFNAYISWENFKHPKQMDLPAKPYEYDKKYH